MRYLLLISVLCSIACETAEDRARMNLRDAGIALTLPSFVECLSTDRTDDAMDLITAGLSPHQSIGSDTPLSLAIRHGKPQIAHRLLDTHSDSTEINPPLLALAADMHMLDVGKRLLESGHYVNSKSIDGSPLLTWCLSKGRYAFAHLLLDYGVDTYISSSESFTLSPLQLATASGRIELSKRLISDGADLNHSTSHNLPPLMLAYEKGHSDLVDILLEKGANPNVSSHAGTPLLTIAVENQNYPLATALLEKGAAVDTLDSSRETALHKALRLKNRSLISLLLKNLANPNLSNKYAQLPLTTAITERNFPLAIQLLFYRADPRNELTHAIARKDTYTTKLLLDYGANPRSSHVPHNDSPLAAAIRTGQTGLARHLISQGASVTAKSRESQTILALAVACGQTEIAQLLMQHGADPNIRLTRPVSKAYQELTNAKQFGWFLRNDSRLTLLMMACHIGDVDLARTLLEGGARKNVKAGHTGLWPINFGSRRADVKIMRLLLGANPEVEKQKIVIDLSEQRLRIYDKSSKVIFSSKVSSGKKGHRTPTGTFAITNKYPTWTSTLYDSEMPYFQRFSCGDFGVHTGYVPTTAASACPITKLKSSSALRS